MWSEFENLTRTEKLHFILSTIFVAALLWAGVCILGSAFNPIYGGPCKP